MNIDYEHLEERVLDGSFEEQLEEELTFGFRQMLDAGEPLPPASHYASQIAEIVDHGATEPLSPELKYQLYQAILQACESAKANSG
jgi:hypothetical protein